VNWVTRVKLYKFKDHTLLPKFLLRMDQRDPGDITDEMDICLYAEPTAVSINFLKLSMTNRQSPCVLRGSVFANRCGMLVM
jgi:hypothetical protein